MDITDHMADMPRYRNWAPTQFDARGLGCADQQDWIVCPVGVNRDTPDHCYTRLNWEVMLKGLDEIDPDGTDYDVCSFGHWGPGWFEIILVRPDSACHRYAAECACALEDYPILDEHDFSEREFEAECEAWKQADLRERIYHCHDGGISIFAARRDELPEDPTGALRESLLGY